MADQAAAGPYAQVHDVLRAVLNSPVFLNGSGPFMRGLVVTDQIKDIKVSRAIVSVHPEWAVELGPLAAATRIKEMCKEYDQRVAASRERTLADVQRRLHEATEAARRLGAEHLITELYALPVPRHRSLVRIDHD